MEIEMKLEDCSPWHHLVFVDELVNDANKEVLCSLCEQLTLGPVYKCLECSFLQHKSCPKPTYAEPTYAEPTYAGNRHRRPYTYGRSQNMLGMWERHHLIFIEEVDNGQDEVFCLGCKEPASVPAYKCSIPECTFFLHESCTQQPHAITSPLLLDQILTLQAPAATANFCDVCLEDCKVSMFYRNFPRDFDVHIQCVFRWQISADDCHQHTPLPMEPFQFTCGSCGEESRAIPYVCTVCRLLTDRDCARFRPTIKTREQAHPLTRIYSVRRVTKQDRIFCKLCRKQVNTKYGAHYCKECDYIAHLKCGSYFESPFLGSDAFASHLVYLVEGNVGEEESVGPPQIQHSSHPELDLLLIHEEPVHAKRCEACLQLIIFNPFYGCRLCNNFFLHSRCAKLPTTIERGQFHQHPLTLHSQQPSTDSLFQCYGCQRYRHGFFYRCNECSYNLDIQCCLIPETIQHHLHEDTLFLAIVGRGNCNFCGEIGYERFQCIECDFNLCLRCTTLPPVGKHRYDKHLLKLHVPCGDDFGENYCIICEEERDPRDYFYYCAECDFAAHFHCVLGKYPFVKFGRSFMDETSRTSPCYCRSD